MIEEVLKQLIAAGWVWPRIDRILDSGWRWRCSLHSGIPDGPIIEGRGVTIEEAIYNAANLAFSKDSSNALDKAIIRNAERIRLYGTTSVSSSEPAASPHD